MDIEQLIRGIRSLLDLLFGGTPPQWLLPGIGWLLAFGLILFGINFVLTQIKKTWTEFLRPIFYDDKDKDRRLLRQRFADHVESEIRRLNNQENWNDYRFVELEAEIEFEGSVRLLGIFDLPGVSPSALRREHSLSRALEKSGERLILLEGEPGSGKSIALRHLAQQLARKAMKSRNVKSVIPVYVNLREFRSSSIRNGAHGDKQPTSEELRTFIFQTLNRVNDRDIDEFLENEFDLGMREGTWLFLFDSFDEIPDVLSSTEVDNVIRGYAGAIDDFLHAMNQCRGVVASREYRGPRRLGWPRFRVLPLSHARRVALIKHSGLARDKISLLIGNLAPATTSFGNMIENPMFLGLLCDYVRDQTSDLLPKHTHAVFENYIVKRLSRDANRLFKRYNKTPEEVRAMAEILAFAMTAQSRIGLSPASEELKLAVQNLGFPLGGDYDSLLDALEFIKLARSNRGESSDAERTFSFSHRRFQEYFATCMVLREPQRVSPQQLLAAAQWREPAVVLLQSQRDEVVKIVLDEAAKALEAFTCSVESESDKQRLADNELAIPATSRRPQGWITEHLVEKFDPLIKRLMGSEYGIDRSTRLSEPRLFERPFPWPVGLLHLLAILQDGSAGDQITSHNLQEKAGFILDRIFQRGTVVDQRWVLEVAGVAQSEVLVKLAEIGFRTKSRWLKEAAYRQVARLRVIPESIAKFIRQEIVDTALDRRLWRERYEVKAYIRRLERPEVFLGTLRLMLLAEPIDYLLVLGAIVMVLETSLLSEPVVSILVTLGLLFILINRWHFRNQEWLTYPLMFSAVMGLFFAPAVYGFWTIGLVYVGAWGSSAIMAARKGRFTHPIWWPVYPIFAVFYLLRLIPIVALMLVILPLALAEMLIRLPINLYSFLKDPIPGSLLLGVLGRLVLLLLFYGVANYLLRIGAPLIAPILVLIALFLLAYWEDVGNFVRDVKRLYVWNKRGLVTLGFPQFISQVGGTKHHNIRSRIIRSVRINNLLEASPENELHLTTILVLAEKVVGLGPEKRIERFFGILPHLQQLDGQSVSWLVDGRGLPKDFIARWNSEDMDELARLVENVKERRKQ